MSHRVPWMVLALSATLVLGVPSAGAVTQGTALTAPITVTGTSGKDELEIELEGSGTYGLMLL